MRKRTTRGWVVAATLASIFLVILAIAEKQREKQNENNTALQDAEESIKRSEETAALIASHMAAMDEESKRADEQVAKLEAELRKMARAKGTTGLVRKVVERLADLEEDSRLETQQQQDRLKNLQTILQKATEEEAKARANLSCDRKE